MKKVTGFYSEKGRLGFMSNWYPVEFTVDGVRYTSSEQYMMHQKALYFGDTETAAKILETDDNGRIKAFGRQVKGYVDAEWAGVRQIIVYRGLLEKFRQNEIIRGKLLATGDDLLAECAPRDCIWGIGVSMQNDDRLDPEKWLGKNLLGFTLMQVREQLRREAE